MNELCLNLLCFGFLEVHPTFSLSFLLSQSLLYKAVKQLVNSCNCESK